MFSETLKSLLKFSPGVGLLALVLSFLVTGGIQLFFYVDVFSDRMDTGFVYLAGISIALIIQGARFAFGIQAVSESYEGKYGKALIGILFSAALTGVETYEFSHIADIWLHDDYTDATRIMLFTVLWLGFALELRLIMNVAGKSPKLKKPVIPASKPHNSPIPTNTLQNQGQNPTPGNFPKPSAP